MPDIVKRGCSPNDEKEFIRQIDKLKTAGQDLYYLINRGYPIKPASVFVGNHYLLSERQRLALVRSIATENALEEEQAGIAHFLIDAPVSNSGRLKSKIADLFEGSLARVYFDVIRDVDQQLYEKENVVSSDAVVLDRCSSWFNLTRKAIDREIGEYPYVRIMEDAGS